MTPSEKSSNLDHHLVDQEKDANPAKSIATLNVGIAGDENSTELDAERKGEVVVNIPQNVLENTDGIANTVVSGRNGAPAMPVLPCHNNHNFPSHKLSQKTHAFLKQLASVFVGYVVSMSPSCSCSCLCSSSHSHSSCSCSCSQSQSSDYSWIKATVVVTILVGFVANLISISRTNVRDTFSSVTAKFGVGAVIIAVIISVGTTLPLHPEGKLLVTVVACLPVLVAIARA